MLCRKCESYIEKGETRCEKCGTSVQKPINILFNKYLGFLVLSVFVVVLPFVLISLLDEELYLKLVSASGGIFLFLIIGLLAFIYCAVISGEDRAAGEIYVENMKFKAKRAEKIDLNKAKKPKEIFEQGIKTQGEKAKPSIKKVSSLIYEDEHNSRKGKTVSMFESSEKVMASLVLGFGTEWQTKQNIDKGDFSIGRGEACNLVLDSENLSRKHAQIAISKTGFVIVDLESANGTFVNEIKLSPGEKKPISDGDIIRFADVECIFRVGR